MLKAQVNQGDLTLSLTLSGTHQILVYADDLNILGGNVHAMQSNRESLAVALKGIGLEVNANKSKYTVRSRNQNAGRSHNIKIDNESFERVEELKYLETNLTNQNSIQEDIKITRKLENVCYRSVQNLLSSSLLPKNLKFKI
jgi:hypothetical protein